jgi:uroporphyrinogen-III synthase
LKTALGGEAFDALLLYSRVAAKTLAKLTDRSVMSRLLARAAFVCISKRVAEPVMPICGERVRVAAEPDEEAMLARLAA